MVIVEGIAIKIQPENISIHHYAGDRRKVATSILYILENMVERQGKETLKMAIERLSDEAGLSVNRYINTILHDFLKSAPCLNKTCPLSGSCARSSNVGFEFRYVKSRDEEVFCHFKL
jgi:hypothetical protein